MFSPEQVDDITKPDTYGRFYHSHSNGWQLFFYHLHPGSLRQLSFFLADTEMNLIIFFIKYYFSFSLDTSQAENALLQKVRPAGAAPLSVCYKTKKRSTRIRKTPKSCTPL
jgi:hypothetical protein